jgi:hypothetical protein
VAENCHPFLSLLRIERNSVMKKINNQPVNETYDEYIISDINPEELRFDYSYQRQPKPKEIQRISKAWNTNLCQALYMTKRCDGSIYTVDGNHRAKSAQKVMQKTKEKIKLCGKVVDLSNLTIKQAVEFEAKMFIAANRERKNLRGLELLKAEAVSGCDIAIRILNTMDSFNFSMKPNQERKNIFCGGGAIKTLKQAYKDKLLNELITLMKYAKDKDENLYVKFLNKEKALKPLLEIVKRKNCSEEVCQKLGLSLTSKSNKYVLERLQELTKDLNLESNKTAWAEVADKIQRIWVDLDFV